MEKKKMMSRVENYSSGAIYLNFTLRVSGHDVYQKVMQVTGRLRVSPRSKQLLFFTY